MKRPMVAFLTQLLLAIRSWHTRRVRLEAENLILRQQLIVLRRKSPARVRLWNIDRLLLVWLYRLYPSLLDAIIILSIAIALRNPWFTELKLIVRMGATSPVASAAYTNTLMAAEGDAP